MQLTKVVKRKRDSDGMPVGTTHDNLMLNTRVYIIQYMEGHEALLTANQIVENLFAQVDEERQ